MTANATGNSYDPPSFPLVTLLVRANHTRTHTHTQSQWNTTTTMVQQGREFDKDVARPPTVQLSNWPFSSWLAPSLLPILNNISDGYRRARLPSPDKYHRAPVPFEFTLQERAVHISIGTRKGIVAAKRVAPVRWQYIPYPLPPPATRMIENYSTTDSRIPMISLDHRIR